MLASFIWSTLFGCPFVCAIEWYALNNLIGKDLFMLFFFMFSKCWSRYLNEACIRMQPGLFGMHWHLELQYFCYQLCSLKSRKYLPSQFIHFWSRDFSMKQNTKLEEFCSGVQSSLMLISILISNCPLINCLKSISTFHIASCILWYKIDGYHNFDRFKH